MRFFVSGTKQHLLLCQDNSAQQLVLQSSHGDGEVDDGGAGADLRGVSRVRQLGGHVQPEALHHVHLFVPQLHLKESRNIKKGGAPVIRRPF